MFQRLGETIFTGLVIVAIGLVVTTLWLQGVKWGMSEEAFAIYYPYYNSLHDSQYYTYVAIYSVILFLIGVVYHITTRNLKGGKRK